VLRALALVWLCAGVTLVAAVVACLADWLDRRRLAWVATQVRVTDVVHGALGPIVAPTVARRRSGPWTVTMALASRDLAAAGRLAEVAREALGQDGKPVQIVFVPRQRP
jgi:hypothetical protein